MFCFVLRQPIYLSFIEQYFQYKIKQVSIQTDLTASNNYTHMAKRVKKYPNNLNTQTSYNLQLSLKKKITTLKNQKESCIANPVSGHFTPELSHNTSSKTSSPSALKMNHDY